MTTPTQRINIQDTEPAANKAVFAAQTYVDQSSLDLTLLKLIEIRASQMNGCGYCLDVHTRDALAAGESQRRLNVLAGWREAAALFTPQEQAVLALTEAVTHIGPAGVSDEVWAQNKAFFSDKQMVQLLVAISTINTRNRLAIATRQTLREH